MIPNVWRYVVSDTLYLWFKADSLEPSNAISLYKWVH